MRLCSGGSRKSIHLEKIRLNYLDLAKSAREAVRKGQVDTGRAEFKGAEVSTAAQRTK